MSETPGALPVLRDPKRADFALHTVGSLRWKSVCVLGGGSGQRGSQI